MSNFLSNVFIVKYPLLLFYIVSYLFSWLFWISGIVLSERFTLISQNSSTLFFIIGSFGPFFSAIFITHISEGKTGIKKLFKRVFNWRVNIRWYFIAVFLFTIINLLSAFSFVWPLGEVTVDEYYEIIFRFLMFFPIYFLIAGIIGGPLGEEIGWHGFAVPRLQKKTNALFASLIHGPIWALWHLPLIYFTGNLSIDTLILYISSITGGCIIITWLFNRVNGSVLLTLIMHTSWNIGGNFLFKHFNTEFEVSDSKFSIIRCALIVITAFIVLLIFNSKKLITIEPV